MGRTSPLQHTRRRSGGAAALMSIVLVLVLAGCGASAATAGAGGGAEATATATSVPAPTATTAPVPTATSVPTQAPVANPKIAMVSSGSGAYSSFGFSPASITIKVGATVVWTNDTVAPHTVTSDPGAPAAFDSGMISANGGTFKHTFSSAGTYTYHCMIHPYMTATIVVVAA